MTVKTTLSFTDRHADFLKSQVEQGIYATTSAAVAAAVETLIREAEAREAALVGMADEIRRRMQTPKEEFITTEEAFEKALARIEAARKS